MKKIFIATLMAMMFSVPALAQTFTDTTLSAPLQVTAPATVLRQYSFHWLPDSFVVDYNLIAADGTIVEQRTCTLTGDDFTAGDAAKVLAGAVGKTYKSVIAGYLQGKCKTKWSLTGTE